MVRNIYVIEEKVGDDSFELGITFDFAQAEKTADKFWDHLTNSEKKTHEIGIYTYEIETDSQDAKTAWNDFVSELVVYPDAVDYKIWQ